MGRAQIPPRKGIIMGREIRRVPANWEHPKRTKEDSNLFKKEGEYIPLYDKDFETAARAWLDECITWENGTHPILIEHPEYKDKYPYFWMWDGNPPNKEYYRPKWDSESTWYQVYETVSEGTPVTPPFATKEELINYLVENGDFWDQERGDGGWKKENAEQFIEREWAPSLMLFTSPQGSIIHAPRDGNIILPEKG
jgi:hypothetical protein